MTTEDDSIIFDNKLYEGYLYKKGKLNKSWKKRYFILCRDRKLKYYSTEQSSSSNKEIGYINLYLVTGISTHKFDNTHIVYTLNNPNIKKNTNYYDEQNAYQSEKDKNKNKKRNRSRTFGDGVTSLGSHTPQIIEYIFKLYTPKRIWHLKCKDTESMNIWTTKIKEVVYGNILYESYLLIEENINKIITNNNKQWKSRWCVLTDKYQLRIYEDDTQSKYKDSIKMEQLNMISYNDKQQFRYYNNRREYVIQLIRTDKQFIIATLSHKSRQIWMDKFSHLMKDELHKMDMLKEGYVSIFEQSEYGLKRWDKRYCGIDSRNYLYFADDFDEFRCFTKGLYFDTNVFEEEKQNELDGYISLFNDNNTFRYGQIIDNDILEIFRGTSEENNKNIFYIEFENKINIHKNDDHILNFEDNIIYIATTSDIELKSWLYSLTYLQKEYYKKHSQNNNNNNGTHLSINKGWIP
eukprot:178106_1